MTCLVNRSRWGFFNVFAYYNTVKSNVLRETGKKKNRTQALKNGLVMRFICGAGERTWTVDLLITNQLRYQLRHTSKSWLTMSIIQRIFENFKTYFGNNMVIIYSDLYSLLWNYYKLCIIIVVIVKIYIKHLYTKGV